MKRRITAGAGLVIAALIAAAAFSACDGDDDTPTPSPTPSPEPTATPTAAATQTATPPPTTPAVTPEPFEGTRGPVERPNPAVPPVAVLTDVRFARHEGFDRVVFEFEDNFPGYRIEYVQPPILQDASGLPVEIAGSAFLQVRFETAVAHDDAGNSTIAEREVSANLPAILEIELTGDFEGQVTWVVGLRQELDFRVTDLTEPNRVVIDIGHP